MSSTWLRRSMRVLGMVPWYVNEIVVCHLLSQLRLRAQQQHTEITQFIVFLLHNTHSVKSDRPERGRSFLSPLHASNFEYLWSEEDRSFLRRVPFKYKAVWSHFSLALFFFFNYFNVPKTIGNIEVSSSHQATSRKSLKRCGDKSSSHLFYVFSLYMRVSLCKRRPLVGQWPAHSRKLASKWNRLLSDAFL